MSPEERLRSYVPLVDFIAEIACPGSDIALYDMRNREMPLAVIRNGQAAARETWGPMSDFAVKLLRQGEQKGKNYVTHYTGNSGGGGKFLKTSTYFIRSDGGEIIGALCISTDLSAFAKMHGILAQMFGAEDVLSSRQECRERLDKAFSVEEMVKSVIEQVLSTYAVDASHMTGEEKKAAVDILNEKGVFLLKGTVAEVAKHLGVSEQTIYRYLK